jgi:hypothetical protein
MVRNEPALADETLQQMVRAIPGRATMLFAARTAAALGDTRGAAEWRREAAVR